jgi:hypothetical protein
MASLGIDKDLSGLQMQEILYFAASTPSEFSRYLQKHTQTVYRNIFHNDTPSLFYVNRMIHFLKEQKGLEEQDIKRIIDAVKKGERSGKLTYPTTLKKESV